MARREFSVAGEYAYDRRSPFRWIVAHVLRYPLLPLGFVLGSIVSSSLFSYTAVLIGQAFDQILSGAGAGVLLGTALAILAVRVAHAVFGVLNTLSIEVLAQRTERDAREELFISLLGKSQTFHNRQRVGDIMARATSDVQQLNFMLNPGASLIFQSLLSIVVPLVAIATIRLDLLLIPLLFLVTFGVSLWRYNNELNPVAGQLRMQFGRMNAALAETIAGIEVVKGYAQEPAEQRKFHANARAYRELFVKQGLVQARYLPLLLFGIAFGLAFGHALLLFAQGALTVGQVIAFLGLLEVLRFPTFISLFTFTLVQLGVAGAERILHLLKDETELDENSGGYAQPVRGELVFEHVSFGYGDSQILKDISFRAAPGETIAIVGQTGAGKTTLTRLVNRTYDASNGRVLVDGVDVRDWSLQALRSQISTIEQDVFLFSRSVAENIAFGAAGRATREQIDRAAHEAQAHGFITALPDGYDTVVGERGVTLSGGQRQRLAIARAFLTDPRILILDDSTSAIDSATEDEIQKAMRQIMRGRTTLLITHRLSQIRWADRILVLKNGELVAQGSHDELLATSQAYRRIFAQYEQRTAPPAPSV